MYFRGNSWEQVPGLPPDASLLVRSVGTDNVQDVTAGIRIYEEETGKQIPYIMAMERKDDVKFYVPKEQLTYIITFLRARLGSGKK